MEIRGREIRFMCTVEAHHKIAALAPDNNIQTILDMLRNDADTVELYTNAALFTIAMSEGYEKNRAWECPGYEPAPLTMEEVNFLRRKDFDELLIEAMSAFWADIGVTVETEEPQKKTSAEESESA